MNASRRARADITLYDVRWLGLLCLSRMSFGLIFMACAGAFPTLMDEWKMSASQAGLIQSGWHVGYLISLLIVGFLADRLGAKKTFHVCSVAACISAWSFALLAHGFTSCLLLFSLTGLCSGGSYTPGLTLIAQRFPANRRGGAMGWYLAASTLGYALALVLSSFMIDAIGWRAAFMAAACGPLIGALIALFALHESANLVVHMSRVDMLRAVWAVWRNKPAMLAIWSYAFHSWELLCLWAWLPAYLTAAAVGQYGTSNAVRVGLFLAALTFALNTVGTVAAGAMSDRIPRTTLMLALTSTSITCSFVFGWLFSAPLWLLTAVAIIYNLSALGDSPIYSTALTELVPPAYLGAAYSLRSALGFGMGAISPVLFGAVLDRLATATGARSTLAWGIAWSSLGLGALAGPFFIARLHGLRQGTLVIASRS